MILHMPTRVECSVPVDAWSTRPQDWRARGRRLAAVAKRLCTRSAIGCGRPLAILATVLVLPLACRSPLGVRGDTGNGTDAALLGLDAGVKLDAVPVDLAATRDTPPDGIPGAFAGLPGHSFEIVASATPPDASARWDEPCRNNSPDTIYDMTFSEDGRKVHLTGSNVIIFGKHATMDGLLTSASDSTLVYSIDDGWAGAELVVRNDGATLVGQLSIFGSGVPVVFCMQSPMKAL